MKTHHLEDGVFGVSGKEVMVMQNKDSAEKKPSLNVSEAEYLLEAVMRFKRDIKHIPEPNEGRIQELKDAIKKGNFVTDEMINEVAAKMSHILLDPRQDD